MEKEVKQKCQSNAEIAELLEFFHFACTSEDINNLAQALTLKVAFNTVIFPVMIELLNSASPTTLGKEMANFTYRLSEVGKTFTEVQILGKCAGAVGNYNAHKVACPDIDWPTVAAVFVTFLGLGFTPYVTQVKESRLNDDLDQVWEVLAEQIQTVMHRYNIPEAYEKLKDLTRRRVVSKESIQKFTNGLQLPEEAKSVLLNLTPQ
ncbi:uncharacterized protein LOC109845840 [Asparagus officinalis]|uniref:uncharacterized protein LOC109845840 n=1 Tax=Asparagus officinalis TaxID=4686 RepID=UPI00098E1AAE|nr:uncharacterized protein LOC109845840 [Asparagus officinalis]